MTHDSFGRYLFKTLPSAKSFIVWVSLSSLLATAVMLWPAFSLRFFPASLRLADKVVVLPPLNPGDQKEVEFQIFNNSNRVATIVGFQASCSCATGQRLPVSLRSGERILVSVAVRNKSQETKKEDIRFSFITDSAEVPFLDGSVQFRK